MLRDSSKGAFRNEHDLVVLEQMLYAELCNGPLKSLTDSERSHAAMLVLAFVKLHSAAYLDLVLDGKMKSYDTDLLCQYFGITREDIEDLDIFMKKGEMRAGVLKENDKGELDYGDDPYFRKGY